MEYYVLVGIFFGIVAFVISFIHSSDWESDTPFKNAVLILIRIIESTFYGCIAVLIWAPALVIIGTIGIIAVFSA